jgi:hypothetical protein
MRRIAATLAFICALAGAADAQEVTASVWAYVPLGINDLDGDLPISLELRVSIPISDRFAFEPFLTAGRRGTSVLGFWGGQIRQRILRLSNKSDFAFATYGASGMYETRFGVADPMVIGHFGFGLHRHVSEHLAFRPEVQLVTFHVVPIGARFVAGFSVH